MKTFEGTLNIKQYKNDSGKKTPLTIDCEDSETLVKEKVRIKEAFLKDGAYQVQIDLKERK